MHQCIRVLAILLPLICGQSAYSDTLPNTDTADWLKTMAFASHQTDYSGTFIYQNGVGGHVEISRITHISDADGEHERLEGLNGARREIVSSNNQVWLFLGDLKVRIERRHGERAFPALLPEQVAILKDNYLFQEAEEDRVAGFHVHAVIFRPKDNLRYTHKMWVHTESGLLLKAVVLDEHGRIIEQYAFTQLAIGGKLDRAWIEKEISAPSVFKKNENLVVPKLASESKAAEWQIDALPSGFKKIKEIRAPMRDKMRPVTHLIFSDGLAGISVFIEDIGGREELNLGLSSQGAIQVYSRVSGDKLVTVVGEVPPHTVIQVAESVRYAGQ